MNKSCTSYINEERLLNLHRCLLSGQYSLAIAESCTGGMIAGTITGMSGSSAYMRGGVVTYSIASKISLLKVDPKMAFYHEAVNPVVAGQMLLGVLALFDAQVGIAVTGFAGPTGGNEIDPVGTVYIAIGSKTNYQVFRYCFDGNREAIRCLVVDTSVCLLNEWLNLEED